MHFDAYVFDSKIQVVDQSDSKILIPMTNAVRTMLADPGFSGKNSEKNIPRRLKPV